MVRIFRDFGQRELNLMVWFGGIFGFLLGIPVAVLDLTFHQWWLLPVLGVVVGWATNALGMWLIFEPPEPRRIWGVKVHGLFPRRQREAAEVYADDHRRRRHHPGEHRRLPAQRPARRPHPADAGGRPRPGDRPGRRGRPPRGAGGARARAATRRSGRAIAREGVEHTHDAVPGQGVQPEQADKIRALVATRTKELPPGDFVEMMRAAIREDEWMLYAHGAIMGFGGGVLHLWIFGVGG